MDVMGITAAEAAARLNVQSRHVRDLIAAGDLVAIRHGSVWAVDPASVNAYERRRRPTGGRHLSQRMSWAALLTDFGTNVSDEIVERFGLRRSEISRLRSLAGREPAGWIWLVHPRATTERFDTYDKYLDRVAARTGVVRGGLSAAGDYGIDIAAHQRTLDVYVPAGVGSELKDQLRLEPSANGNLTVRTVDALHWNHLSDLTVMPRAVVAVDLLGDADPRTASAGRDLIESILHGQ